MSGLLLVGLRNSSVLKSIRSTIEYKNFAFSTQLLSSTTLDLPLWNPFEAIFYFIHFFISLLYLFIDV